MGTGDSAEGARSSARNFIRQFYLWGKKNVIGALTVPLAIARVNGLLQGDVGCDREPIRDVLLHNEDELEK